jgi:hypothetical protein
MHNVPQFQLRTRSNTAGAAAVCGCNVTERYPTGAEVIDINVRQYFTSFDIQKSRKYI